MCILCKRCFRFEGVSRDSVTWARRFKRTYSCLWSWQHCKNRLLMCRFLGNSRNPTCSKHIFSMSLMYNMTSAWHVMHINLKFGDSNSHFTYTFFKLNYPIYIGMWCWLERSLELEYIIIQTLLWVDALVWILQLVFPQFKHNLSLLILL